jgi:hypothetical protein
MMRGEQTEREYFERRAAEERAAAAVATDPIAQRAHVELASCFDQLARSIGSGDGLGPLRARIGGTPDQPPGLGQPWTAAKLL